MYKIEFKLNTEKMRVLLLVGTKTNKYFFLSSFYNWETQTSTSNPTPNYLVMADNAKGLIFKNKRDRKKVDVDPKVGFYYYIHILTC